MKAIQVQRLGGPEVLQPVELAEPVPAAGEVLLRLEAVGVNFVDTQQRQGFPAWYRVPTPFVPGFEGAGTVAAVGSGVDDLAPGDRVAYSGAFGAYAQYATVPAAIAVPVPDGFDLRSAAAALVQGMTAHYLLHDCYAVRPGDWVLVHAGAGGTGGLVTQMAKHLGATVVATASSAAKQAVATENGADHVLDHGAADFAAKAKALPGFPGFAAVYDSIGQATFETGLSLLRRRGVMVVYGAASGPVPPFDINRLNPMGSLTLMRPNLKDFVATREALLARSGAVFAMIRDGQLKVRLGACLPLADAARAHEMLQSRRSTGKLLLIP